MYCKNCGAELPEGAKFCTSCGREKTTGAEAPYTDRMDTTCSKRPNTYLALGILVTIFCCLPFGIVSIVYASKVDSCWNNGRKNEAMDNSRKAKNWALWGLFISLAGYLIYILLLLFGATSAFWLADIFSETNTMYDIMMNTKLIY